METVDETGPDHPRWIRSRPVEDLPLSRLVAAKRAFTTRRVPLDDPATFGGQPTLIGDPIRPRSGDLMLARVTRLGHHRRLELVTGRRSVLHIGDEIVVTYGDRYAPDQFEAEVPRSLGPTQLLASGGVAATSLSRHEGARRPTDVQPIGLVGDADGNPLNLSGFAIDPVEPTLPRPRTIAVIGTSMNSGKTTSVASLVRGLRRGGVGRPGATKVTGTGSGADYWVMVDAGAHRVVDFTDAGLSSTYRIPLEVIEANLLRLVDHLTEAGCSEIVVEVADGLFRQETARLVRSEVFRSTIDLVLFAAADSMGAVAGVRHLQDLDLPVVGVSGLFTRSPLAAREVAAEVDVPVLSRDDLASPSVAAALSTVTPPAARHPVVGTVDDHPTAPLEVIELAPARLARRRPDRPVRPGPDEP